MTLQQNLASKDERSLPPGIPLPSLDNNSRLASTMHEAIDAKRHFTQREFLIMLFLSIACLTEGSCFAHISPFYAEEVSSSSFVKTYTFNDNLL